MVKLKLDAGHPAYIELLRTQLKPGAVPVLAKQLCYSHPKRDFICEYIRELLILGFVKKRSSYEWWSVPLIVPKHLLGM